MGHGPHGFEPGPGAISLVVKASQRYLLQNQQPRPFLVTI